MTEWKPVVGYESEYEVSSDGAIRSIRNNRNSKVGRVLHQSVRAGYSAVSLCRHGVAKSAFVHRVVAAAFFGAAEGRVVNHKNGNKHDNRLENLEYCTHAQNERHKHEHLQSGRGDGVPAKLTAEQVEEMRGFRLDGWTYKQLAARFSVCISNAHAVCSRHTWRRI